MGSYYIPPVNFGMVEDNLYRSGQPGELNFPFLEKLKLKKILYLSNEEPPSAFLNFVTEQGIEFEPLGALHDFSCILKSQLCYMLVLSLLWDKAMRNKPKLRASSGNIGEERQSAQGHWSPMSEENVKMALQQILDVSFSR